MAGKSKPLVLIVEDETDLVTLLEYNLGKEGYDVLAAEDGEEGLFLARQHQPDVLLLDWMLPRLSGLDMCRQLRKDRETRDIPILMLTAKAEETDKVRGLDSGADDYIAKPFSPAELVARIRAVMRRSLPGHNDEVLTVGELELDVGSHRVRRAGRQVDLGPTEFRLLKQLMEKPGRVFSRDQLLDAVWGQDIHVDTRTVDVHIRRLRKALNADGEADIVRTVRGTGYALAAGEEA